MKTLTERTADAIARIDSQLAICNAANRGDWGTWNWDDFSENDASFIPAARTGYPAMLEGMKAQIEIVAERREVTHIRALREFCGDILESIFAKIEAQ